MSLFDSEGCVSLPHRMGHASVLDLTSKSILGAANGHLSEHDFNLNPYRSCSFGCGYCYASFFAPDKRQADWGHWVEVKSNAAELLRRERKLAGANVIMGSSSDPYQPVEMRTGLTRSLLQVMLEVVPQPRLIIQTRSPMVVRDVDLLRQFHTVRVDMTVPTDDDSVRKQFEPTAPSILRRIQALKMLKAARVKTGVRVSPMLPLRDPEGLVDRLRALGPERVSWGPFHTDKRDYVAGTPRRALELAERMGWDQDAYDRAAARLRSACDRLPGEVAGSAEKAVS